MPHFHLKCVPVPSVVVQKWALTEIINSLRVKNGKKVTTIRLAAFNYIPTVMKLAKQRYYCRECHHHWTAQTSLVAPNCFISRHIRLEIARLLKERIAMTLIAKLCFVSSNTVIRELHQFKKYLPNKQTLVLPKVLIVDEFRSYAKKNKA